HAQTEAAPLQVQRRRREDVAVSCAAHGRGRAAVEKVHVFEVRRECGRQAQSEVEMVRRIERAHRRSGGIQQVAIDVFGDRDVRTAQPDDPRARLHRTLEEVDRVAAGGDGFSVRSEWATGDRTGSRTQKERYDSEARASLWGAAVVRAILSMHASEPA